MRRSLLPALIAVSSLLSPLTALANYKTTCIYSYWAWQGGERVKVCCNQQNFCVTKFGVYSQG